MKKKLLSIVLSLLMMLTLMPQTALPVFAAENDQAEVVDGLEPEAGENAQQEELTEGETPKAREALMAISEDDVCSIGDVGYQTLAGAFQAVQDGETIKMRKSITLDSALETDKTFTLDLQGMTIWVNGIDECAFTFDAGSEVTIVNGTVESEDCVDIFCAYGGSVTLGEGLVVYADLGGAIDVEGGGSAVLNGAEVNGATPGNLETKYYTVSVAEGSFTMEDGELTGEAGGVGVAGEKANAEINGGTLTCGGFLICAGADLETKKNNGLIIVNGGTFTNSTGDTFGAVMAGYGGSVVINDAEIEMNSGGGIFAYETGSVEINDGSITVKAAGYPALIAEHKSEIFVYDGVFNGNVYAGIEEGDSNNGIYIADGVFNGSFARIDNTNIIEATGGIFNPLLAEEFIHPDYEQTEAGEVIPKPLVIDPIPDQVYTGDEIKPEVTVRFGSAEDAPVLTEDEDYVLKYEENVHVGSGIVTAEGVSGTKYYEKSATRSFKINKRRFNDYDVVIEDQTFTGSEIRPAISLADPETGKIVFADVDPADYNASWNNNVNAGIASVTISGTPEGNFDGTNHATFNIGPADFDTPEVKIELDKNVFNVNDEKTVPTATLTFGDYTLKEGVDYTVSYEKWEVPEPAPVKDPKDPGEYLMEFTPVEGGNFEGEGGVAVAEFSIKEVTFTVRFNTHGGKEIPEQEVAYGDTATDPGRPSYGEYEFYGWFAEGEYDEFDFDTPITEDMTIEAIWELPLPTAIRNFTYDGEEHMPIEPSEALILDGMYSGTIAGTYFMTITPDEGFVWEDGYDDPLFGVWRIDPAVINEVIIDPQEYVYTGEAIEPVVEVRYGDGIVAEDYEGYTVSYMYNEYVGTAQVIVTGIGNLQGTITATFEITEADKSALVKAVMNAQDALVDTSDMDGFDLEPGTEYTSKFDRLVMDFYIDMGLIYLDYPDLSESEIQEIADSIERVASNYKDSIKIAVKAIAQIGEDEFFTSLGDAVAAADEEDVIVLLENVEENLAIDKTVNIDLGKNRITLNGTGGITVSEGGRLTIGNGAVLSEADRAVIIKGGTLVISDEGIIRAKKRAVYVEEGKLGIIEGGVISVESTSIETGYKGVIEIIKGVISSEEGFPAILVGGGEASAAMIGPVIFGDVVAGSSEFGINNNITVADGYYHGSFIETPEKGSISIYGGYFYDDSGNNCTIPEKTVIVKDADSYYYTLHSIYSVEFMVNGEQYGEIQEVIEGRTAEEPEAPTYGYYTFDGWYDEEGVRFNFEDPVEDDLVLHAEWSETVVDIPVSGTDIIYDGLPVAGVTADKGVILTGEVEATDAGTYEVKASLEEGCVWPDGSREDITVFWKIKPAHLLSIAPIDDQEYTGEEITPKLTIEYENNGVIEYDPAVLYEDLDAVYVNCIYPGTALVIVTGLNNFYGTVMVGFNIVADTCTISFDPGRGTGYMEDEYVIKGDIYDIPTVEFKAPVGGCHYGNLWTLVSGEIYEIGSETPVQIGKPIHADENYVVKSDVELKASWDHVFTDTAYSWGARYETATASRQCLLCDVSEIETVETKAEETKAPTYTEAGEMTYTAKFTERDFETQVKKVPIPALVREKITSVTLKYSSLTYTGAARTQSTTAVVKAGDKVLTRNVDYTLSYQNNVDAGTAVMIVKGKGAYRGTLHAYYKIKPAPVKKASLTKTKFNYKGQAWKPITSVQVYGDKNGEEVLLTRNKDYRLAYSNNVNVGTASVIVIGIGNYTGTKTVNFTIVPTMRQFADIKAGKGSVRLKWTRYKEQATGYEYQYSKTKDFSKDVVKGTVNIYDETERLITRTATGLTSGEMYYFRLRTVTQVGDKKYYSDWNKTMEMMAG